MHCVDGEPVCANDDLHSECTSCMVATAKEYMVTKQQQIVLGGGWGIESKHVFNRESFFRLSITKASTVATVISSIRKSTYQGVDNLIAKTKM